MSESYADVAREEAAVYDDIASAIAQKSVERAIRLMFVSGDTPRLRVGRNTETDLWDFKGDCPAKARDAKTENGWASTAADVLAFHNHRGGLIFFGIEDSRFEFKGASRTLDSKLFNDRIRPYVGDSFWVDFHREYIQRDQRYLGVALIPPRGPAVARFKSRAPEISGRRLFDRGGSAVREGDSTRLLTPAEADKFARQQSAPTYGQLYSIDEPMFRVLAPEYANFLERPELAKSVERSLRDTRVSVTSLIGVGGLGKTALATWVTNRSYESGDFQFIVSSTAKDRELTATGILGLSAPLTSFADLLNQILEVLGFMDVCELPLDEREKEVRALLAGSEGLLFVDNLETVDDTRLISFLDNLPIGVKAIVTSRRNTIRVAARPIEIPPLAGKEIVKFVRLLQHEKPFEHASGMSDAQAEDFGSAWDGIPLAIRWALARSRNTAQILSDAETPALKRLGGQQLLEFSFRRVFESLQNSERAVLQALAIIGQPIPTEAVVAGSGLPGDVALDAVEELVADALVQRVFDSDRNDYCFVLLPVTRAFMRLELQKKAGLQQDVQRRLTRWFQADDIRDDDERVVVQEVRSGRKPDDASLTDLARAADKRGDLDSAEKLHKQATTRNPRSWRAARDYAEFLRHRRRDTLSAIDYYEKAAANSPSRGVERSKIYRELGILIRDSGAPDALSRAEEKLVIAQRENSEDPVARHALAGCLDRAGKHRALIKLLEPYRRGASPEFRRKTLPLLLRAYEKTNEIVLHAELKRELAPVDGR